MKDDYFDRSAKMTSYLFKEYTSRCDFIKQYLAEEDYETVTKAVRDLVSVLPPTFQYNLVLIGPVGVGKSTICTLLYYLLDKAWETYNTDVFCYPEFLQINTKEGNEILKEHLNGTITSYEFQKYILHCWTILMNNQPIAPVMEPCRRFNVFERCCDDSVICFSNLWHKQHPESMSEDELQLLFKLSQVINGQYNLPTYFNPDGVSINKVANVHITTVLLEILSIIKYDFENSSTRTSFVMLDTDVETLKHRIHVRSRPGEHAYSEETITAFHRHYQLLFDKVATEGKLNGYEDLSELV